MLNTYSDYDRVLCQVATDAAQSNVQESDIEQSLEIGCDCLHE